MSISVSGVLLTAGAYLLGSVPAGLWLGLALRGVDVREHGSGNIGATNTFRTLGARIGGAALACDILKGLVPVAIAKWGLDSENLAMVCGLAAILGHSFSIFLKFRGGKGVATSAGVFLGLLPAPMLLAASVFAGVFAATRIVSASSMAAALALGIAAWLIPHFTSAQISLPLQVLTTSVVILVVVKHRTNLRKLLRGEENRFN